MALKCLEEIEHEAKAENIDITMGYVGQVAPNFGIDNMVLFMRGPDDGQLRVALSENSGIKLVQLREKLREVLPKRVIPWLAERLVQGGLAEPEAQRQAKMSTFGFQPGDIVTSVMSFGSLTPIAVRVVGTDLKMVRQHAEKIAEAMKRIPSLRDVQFEQTLDYPTVEVDIDREKAGLSGATVDDVAKALVMATASTRFASLNYWIDVKTGFDYLVQLQMPPLRMEKPEDVETLPIESVNPEVNLMIRDVATVRTGTTARRARSRHVAALPDVDCQRRTRGHGPGVAPGQSRRSSRPVSPLAASGSRPMGQLPPMLEMFKSLGIGLAVAVFVIFVLLTAYFQSPRLALISIGAVPGVLAGIATILYFTNTSLNIESFMGSIMCLGVSVSNSVMLVTFMDEHWKRRIVVRDGGDHRRGRAAAADPDDRLCDDRRHGADGAGARARQPDAGPARPGCDRRAGDVDIRHLAGPPLRLRGRDRQERRPIAFDQPRRSRKLALRPTRLHGAQHFEPRGRSHCRRPGRKRCERPWNQSSRNRRLRAISGSQRTSVSWSFLIHSTVNPNSLIEPELGKTFRRGRHFRLPS